MRASRRMLVVLGLLWGAGVMAVQGLAIPPADGGLVEWSTVAWALPGWTLVGIALAFAVDRAARRLSRPAWVAAAVVVASVPLSASWSLFYSVGSEWFAATEWSQARLADPLGAFAYQAWLVAFYGGGYAVAWSLHRRSVHSREVLAQIEMAHLARSTRAGAAELERVRGLVDPRLILRTIGEARRRLARGDPSVDRLLSHLVSFLRAATGAPAPRGSVEADQRYRELMHELEVSHDPA